MGASRVMAEVVKPLLETQSLEASVSGSIHNDVMETLRSVCATLIDRCMLCITVTKHGNTFAHKPQHWAYLNRSLFHFIFTTML